MEFPTLTPSPNVGYGADARSFATQPQQGYGSFFDGDANCPNTSPDVATIGGELPAVYFGGRSEVSLPGGTILYLAPGRHDRHGECIHKVYPGAFPGGPAVADLEKDAGIASGIARASYVTVAVGPATFRKGKTAHFAVAVQNVTAVSTAVPKAGARSPGFTPVSSSICVADRLYTRVYNGVVPYLSDTKEGAEQSSRCITAITPYDRGLGIIRGDLGGIVYGVGADIHAGGV